MSWLRFTIAQLMAIVLFAAIGMAALRNASKFWASAVFTLAILTVSVAIVGAVARTGKLRMAWAGYAVAGWSCLIIWLATPNTVGYMDGPPRLIVYWGLLSLQGWINPTAGAGAELIAYAQISHTLEVIFLGLAGSVLGRCFPLIKDRPDPG